MTGQLDVEARRRQLLDAAAKLIAERGYHAVRIADIAEVVGTSTGTVHYHFPGKDDVLRAALQHALDRAYARQSEALRDVDDAHDRVLALIDMQLPRPGEVRNEWSIWLQVWAEASIRPELRDIHEDYYERWLHALARALERGIEHGVFPHDLDPDDVARQLAALIDGLAIQVLSGSRATTVEKMRALVVAFLERARVPAP